MTPRRRPDPDLPDWHGPTPIGGLPIRPGSDEQPPVRGRLTSHGKSTLAAMEATDRYDTGGSSALREARRRLSLRQRMLQRRRRSAVLLLLTLAAIVIGIDVWQGPTIRQAGRPVVPASPSRNDSASPTAANAPTAATFPGDGRGQFAFAAGHSPIRGRAGNLQRYRVAVETGTQQDLAAFTARVDQILSANQGWTAGRTLRFQQVSGKTTADFTIYLATPGTSERICATGGLQTNRFTNCRISGKVIINMARWWQAVPGYGAPLNDYRAYAVNHEVGHQLGYGHEACPGPGAKAPVMQQQTLGLHGCVAYSWPYVKGRRYAGAPVA